MIEVTYLDLVEAVRKGKCMRVKDSEKTWSEDNLTVQPFVRQRDFAVPSYDFGYNFDKISSNDFERLLKIGNELIEAGSFILPHEAFVLMISNNHSNVIIYIGSTYDNLNIMPGENIDYDPCFVAEFYNHYHGEKRDVWLRSDEVIDCKNAFQESSVQLTEEACMINSARRAVIIVCIVLLNYRRYDNITKTHQIPQDDHWMFVNRSRIQANREPVTTTQRIIYISTNLERDIGSISAKPGVAGLRNLKIGHERRSHLRTYKSGKVVTVRACKVKGGASASDTATVKIRNR